MVEYKWARFQTPPLSYDGLDRFIHLGNHSALLGHGALFLKTGAKPLVWGTSHVGPANSE